MDKVERTRQLPKLLWLTFAALFLFLTLFFPTTTGFVGRLMRWSLFSLIGGFAYTLPLVLALIALGLYCKEEISLPFIVLVSIACGFSLGLLHTTGSGTGFLEQIQNGGGIAGYLIFKITTIALGKGGFYLLLLLAWLFCLSYFSPLFAFFGKLRKNRKQKTLHQEPERIRGEKRLKRKEKPKASPESPEREHPLKKDAQKTPKEPSPVLSEKSKLIFPPLELLAEPENKGEDLSLIKEKEQAILKTLQNFGVEAKVTDVRIGPRITRFEIQPAAGVKVKEIVSLSDDLSLHLAVSPIRIEAPIPGKSALGIEIPNSERSTVFLREFIEDLPFIRDDPAHLYYALGKDISGEKVIADLTRMPHLLIAGATGSGKSVCISTLIASLLFRAQPEDVRFLMIDPKRVELTLYNGVPHLLTPVVTDPKQATQALEVVISEMEERYDAFSRTAVRNIQSYNERASVKLPYWVVVIDELADLMFQSSIDTERFICRIAQLSRATGIHLVIATQRPSVNVITGLIKANIPSRIAFAVASQTDSRVVLDVNGAERLLGEGDMLFLPIEESKPRRLQGVFVSEQESRNLAEFWRNLKSPDYDPRFDTKTKEEADQNTEEEWEDALLPKVLEIILTTRQPSASLLQRKLRIGYARAGRLIDILEKRGILGKQEGAKPREILVSDDVLYQMIQKEKSETSSAPTEKTK